MKKIYPILVLCGAIALLHACSSSNSVNNEPVKDFNINRYLGKWYEVARYDHGFEKGMTHCTATYSMNSDGNILVVSKGMKNGDWKESEGKVKTTSTPGLLRVSFFWPFYSDYRVLMLASDYTYALVGSDSSEYLWVLSRTPELPALTLSNIMDEAKRRGYDTSKLIMVQQKDELSAKP